MNKEFSNLYGDKFSPTIAGRGVDVTSQRQDELDLSSLAFIRTRIAEGKSVHAIDLGGGFGTHSIQMACLGAFVTMVDLDDMATENFKKALDAGLFTHDKLHFVQKDFSLLDDKDIPQSFDLLYSQRAIHYLPYLQALGLLKWMCYRMADKGAVFISAAGWDTEYGKTYPDRGKAIEERYDFLTPDMQQKYAIIHKIVTYKEEEMASLLEKAGFSEIHVFTSPFGNIKATAVK